ncbi:MAG: hypothetical protein KAS21_02215 [Candidatus Aminicenantes bacterium]|nr:hypothetical protein [Candidatus Aminicenantes bacterium]MCK5003869.1 hypothetical protein [Candidatus Aminicenantes bacterium]
MEKNGSVILAVIFMFLVLFLGLSLLNFTLVHNRVVKARNIHHARSEILHNLLIFHLHKDTDKIKNIKFNSSIDDCKDHFNNILYPDSEVNSVKVKKSFSFNTRDFSLFKLIKVNFGIKSISSNERHIWKSESIFNIITGDLPFNLFPVLINSGGYNISNEKFIKDLLSSTEKHHIFISEHESVFDIKLYLAKLLGLDRENVTLIALKQLFEQTEYESELRDGIYFPCSSEKAGPVFVQGNTEKVMLSIEDECQIIEIVQNNNHFKIKYSKEQFHYETGEKSGNEYKIFNGKIIINGNVNVLEAGSDPALAIDSHPELIILGDLNICSSITGNITTAYYNSRPSITIILAASPFSLRYSIPVLRFDCAGPIIIHGSININGGIINDTPEIQISGNLYCRDLKNKGKIKVTPLKKFKPPSIDNFYIKNLTVIKDFRTELIEEIFEDEK